MLNKDSIDKAHGKVSRGERLSREDVCDLLLIKSDDALGRLFALADTLNHDLNEDVVSFVLNRNINFTNSCVLRCSFCAYATQNFHDQYVLQPEEIVEKVSSAPISEISIQGALNPTVSLDYVKSVLQTLKRSFPHIHIHGFSPMEIYFYAKKEGFSHEKVLEILHEAGLDSLCGTAAEILDDTLRAKICEGKLSSDMWCSILEAAHQRGIPSTATILYGHIETAEQIADHFERIADIQSNTGMITEFILLPFMPHNTLLGKRYDLSFSGLSRAKHMVAVSRIYFYNYIRNIQPSWVKLGLDQAVECLSVGANDLGGTLFEENITRLAGGQYGQYVPKNEFFRVIHSIGKKATIRDTIYSFQSESITV